MKPRAVRFSDEAWEIIGYEAAREGVSNAEYIRMAALSRAFYSMGERGEDPGKSIAEIAKHLRQPDD